MLYCETKNGEHQYTVITSERGTLLGKRIVRGRELECMDYYDRQKKEISVSEVENPARFERPIKAVPVA